jgi:hypothetical protein
LLVQLRTTTTVGTEIAAAKLADTTTSIRTAAGNVSTAANGFGDMREDLQASLATCARRSTRCGASPTRSSATRACCCAARGATRRPAVTK